MYATVESESEAGGVRLSCASRKAASETTATNPAGGVPSGDQVVAPIAVPVNIGATMLNVNAGAL